jgi:hypothetical protein
MNSWNHVGWALLGAVIFGVPFGFLAYLIEWDTLAPLGAALGATIFLTAKKNREGKQ